MNYLFKVKLSEFSCILDLMISYDIHVICLNKQFIQSNYHGILILCSLFKLVIDHCRLRNFSVANERKTEGGKSALIMAVAITR